MNLQELVNTARDKNNFRDLSSYIDFCQRYLDFADAGLQATIISQNEIHYRFFQYKQEGHFNITRPINSQLMYTAEDAALLADDFRSILRSVRELPQSDSARREILVRGIYTIQQSIGATLDALPANGSNFARKINGDLFERLIQFLIREVGVECRTGTVQVPISVDQQVQFHMSYQHDLLLYGNDELKAIGSVKTSSKDRIDKIFLDKFLYCKLTETALPHIAIFLNDVQRKATKREDQYGVNSTFLSGHFKAFTVKLNPLDGVYYCDIRPNMQSDPLLNPHIHTIDQFFCSDLWELVAESSIPLAEVKVVEEEQP
jgi:hypothetical protein